MHHFVHLYGNPEDRNELHSSNFKDWEAVAFKHPGYLEDMWKQACDAYAWSSFDPEIRGETDIMIYGEELHNDLQLMPEGERGKLYHRLPAKTVRTAIGPLALR